MLVLALDGCRPEGDVTYVAAPCTAFEDMAITDPEGIAGVEVMTTVEEAIAEFQAWTGREGVCVNEVRFVSRIEREESAEGRYEPSYDLIELEVSDHLSEVELRTLGPRPVA